jgi:hypothetical protein
MTSPSSAQDPAAPANGPKPFEISDNSFLVEEALNQEPGVFQNILTLRVDEAGEWETAFTQEWPLFSHRHQISFTVPYAASGGASGFGDAFVHYRLQAVDGGGGWPAFSPRVSLVVPSGRASRGLGQGNPGWQVNLPVSKQVHDLYVHLNAGFSHFPSAEIEGATYNLLTPHVAASGIWRASPMVNLLLEGIVEWEEQLQGGALRHATVVTIVPGLRTGWNMGDTQTIVGIGVPVRMEDGATDAGAFLYFSYERPFSR